MQAVVYDRYGSPEVLRLEEVPKPEAKDHEVLVQIHASSVNAADSHLLRGQPALLRLEFGLFKPKRAILGADIAGRVVAVGSSVTQFQPGDDVFGDLSSCGFGGFAEYVAVPASAVIRKPMRLTFEQAAAVPLAALTALQSLQKVQLQAGQSVMIHGASGGVGTFAVQLAKVRGAEVTSVCGSNKVELANSLGADHVIDYSKENFAASAKRYDAILSVGGDRSIFDYKRALRKGGKYLAVGGSMKQLFQAMLLGPLLSATSGKTLGNILAKPNQQDLSHLADLLGAGKVAPVIDRCYPLAKVAEALAYLESGQAKGKVTIFVSQIPAGQPSSDKRQHD